MRFHSHSAMGLVNGSGYYSHMDNLPIAHSLLRVYTSSIPERDWMIPIYRHALSRDPDQGGLDGWAGYLAANCSVGRGRVAITTVLTGPEMTNPATSGLNWLTSGVEERVRRLYRGMLGRNPDTGGFDFWTDYVLSVSGQDNRIAKFQEMVAHFAYSPEFTQRFDHGTQGDRPACSQ